MRQRLLILCLLLLFWMLFFSTARGVFLLYNYSFAETLTTKEIFTSMAYGLKMDASTTGYFVVLSGLLIIISVWTTSRWLIFSLHSISIGLLLFSCVIIMIDLELYRHWGFRMNITPFFYMGSEAAGSISTGVVLKLVSIIAVLFSAFAWLYFRLIHARMNKLKKGNSLNALLIFITLLLLFFPIRGSLGTSTMNVGMVYYHKKNLFANHTGINVVWNFLYSLSTDNALLYPENLMPSIQTDSLFATLYPKQDTTIRCLNTDKPNILLIILESYTAGVIQPLGGRPGITPNLNALCKEGILFDQFYANGDRTDKGLVSILSGFPAQPKGSIIKYPQKTQKLPHLSIKLKELGYNATFVYGGDADFANYRSYLTNGQFDHLTSDEHFDSELIVSKWGVYDEHVFQKALEELDTATHQPFFKVVLTLTSHEPFQIPIQPVFPGNDNETKFLNSCYYTDECLGKFIEKAKQKPWWKNTLVIITADHGHRFPDSKSYEIREKFHIPMLWIGGAVQKDAVISTLANQTDLANTVLAQVSKPSPDFPFSKNILGKPVGNFAMYIFNDGYGYLTPTVYAIHDNPGNQYLKVDGVVNQNDLDVAKAYIQKLYREYNAKK